MLVPLTEGRDHNNLPSTLYPKVAGKHPLQTKANWVINLKVYRLHFVFIWNWVTFIKSHRKSKCLKNKIIPFTKMSMRKVILLFHTKHYYLVIVEKQNDESCFLITCPKIERWAGLAVPCWTGACSSVLNGEGFLFEAKMTSTTHMLWIVCYNRCQGAESFAPVHPPCNLSKMCDFSGSQFRHLQNQHSGIRNLRQDT